TTAAFIKIEAHKGPNLTGRVLVTGPSGETKVLGRGEEMIIPLAPRQPSPTLQPTQPKKEMPKQIKPKKIGSASYDLLPDFERDLDGLKSNVNPTREYLESCAVVSPSAPGRCR
ncbi:MAG: hypothetical protein NTW04_04215, partial [Elusimicrobia bacterium]|nr:hypothetical protein [Elusimicrobiota bacterium]